MSADADLLLYQDKNDDGELGGDEIISASERSGAENETIENVTLDPGKYFLSVEAYEGNTNYSLSLAGVAGTVAPDLAGDRPSTARLLPPDGEVELHDYVGGADAVDAYRLEVLNAGYLDLFAENRKADLNLTVWSDRNSNNQLDADEIVAQGTNEIQEDNIDPGTYYVNVSAPGAPTPYKISAISEPGSREDIENYDPLFPGIPTTGTLTQNDNFDPEDEENYADPYLLAELGAGLTVTVTQQSDDFDAYLRVVDQLTGKVIVENDDISTSGGDFDAQVSFTTEPGVQYVVFASSVDAPGLGDYTLNTTVTGTPVANALRSASADTPLPQPSFTGKGGATKIFTYAALDGGKVSSGLIRLNSMHQNLFGDCYFLAAMTATFGKINADLSDADSKPSTVFNSAISTSTDGANYTIKFFDDNKQPQNIVVDNQVVTSEGKLFGATWVKEKVAATDAQNQPIWAPIFERAYAKFRGGYDVIGKGGSHANALIRLTNKATDFIHQWNPSNLTQKARPGTITPTPGSESDSSFSEGDPIETDQVFDRIQTALDGGGYVAAGTVGGGDDTKKLYNGVLYQSHAYSVHNAYERKDGQKLILLRNPWGTDNGNNNAKAAEDPSDKLNDGFITIKFEEFLKNFSTLSLSKP